MRHISTSQHTAWWRRQAALAAAPSSRIASCVRCRSTLRDVHLCLWLWPSPSDPCVYARRLACAVSTSCSAKRQIVEVGITSVCLGTHPSFGDAGYRLRQRLPGCDVQRHPACAGHVARGSGRAPAPVV